MPLTTRRPPGPARPATRLHTLPRQIAGTGFRVPWDGLAPDPGEHPCRRLDMSLPQSARVEDVLLGGKTSFPADQTAARQVLDGDEAEERAVARKCFRTLAAAHLARLPGADQLIDFGCGLPLPPQLLQASGPGFAELHRLAAPGSTVVHVDKDPLVMTHARALLAAPQGGAVAVRHHETDFADPAGVLGRSGVPIAWDRPVALLFFDVLHEIPDAHQVLDAYKAAVRRGSWLVVSHRSADSPAGGAEADGYRAAGLPCTARTREEVAALVEGWDLLGPGVAPVREWSPSLGPTDPRAQRRASGYAVIARKP
ncbi:SAM-dependent methyltransferase [Kitasatospora sp. MBT63]|uniref:SAM-dependent methyltransferase n=1 Tax=Kitasatospora sp. MBT63 TaxID=1444768 RepID=UPI00053AAB5E|nr:SAM-dependent methyltransferase [Kitasatospora sp. MBT63]